MVLEVVGCWAESLANQQRIARDSDQGLKSESREKSATPEGNRQPNKERRENREEGEQREPTRRKEKKKEKWTTLGGITNHKLMFMQRVLQFVWTAPAMLAVV